MINFYRNQLRLDALRKRDKEDSDFVAFMIGLAALCVLIGAILLLYGGYYVAAN